MLMLIFITINIIIIASNAHGTFVFVTGEIIIVDQEFFAVQERRDDMETGFNTR